MKIELTLDSAWLRRLSLRLAVGTLLVAVLYPTWLWAGTATIPNSFTVGQVIRAADMNANFTAMKTAIDDNDARIGSLGPTITPVGGVVAWLKSLPGVPALPGEYVECNGQVLADPQSPLNGVTVPDLNGGNRFLRGSATSGTVGGSDTHTHTFTSGTADFTVALGAGANAGGPFVTGAAGAGLSMLAVKGTNSTASTLPAHYEVVWVIRVK